MTQRGSGQSGGERTLFIQQDQLPQKKKKRKRFTLKLGKAEGIQTPHSCHPAAVQPKLLNPIKLKLFQEGMLNYNDNFKRRSHNSGVEQLQNKLLLVASHRTLERMRFNRGAVAEQLTAATRRSLPYTLLYPQPQFHPFT